MDPRDDEPRLPDEQGRDEHGRDVHGGDRRRSEPDVLRADPRERRRSEPRDEVHETILTPPQRPKRRGIYLLPNLFTTGTLFAGFYAIVAAIDGNFDRAAIAVFGALLFDGLDGRVARWTRTESTFGKEYDSLSDMVAFGLAPAIMVYQWGVERLMGLNLTWGRIGWLVAFFYAVAAALRLARFNARTAQVDKRYFEGLPSPSAAAVTAAFVWCAYEFELGGLNGLVLAFVVTALAGVLMVSRFYYPSFKGLKLTGRVKFGYALAIPLTFVIIAAEPPVVLFTLFGAFALSAPLIWLWRRFRRRPPSLDTGGAGPR